MSKLLNEIHPGEILLEDFMKPMGMNALQLAARINVSPRCINELVNGASPVTPDIAMLLGLFFSMEPRFWLSLQEDFDQRVANNL
jgi:addiction module HigA family antidote